MRDAPAPGDLIVVVPLSSSLAPSGLRVDVGPIAGIGSVDPATMEQIEAALALILGLDRGSPPG
ncbi:MAG: hypothetical protein ACYDB7_05550 [Mycobacteriales bacterium]